MQIVYRDRREPRSIRQPAWIPAGTGLERVSHDGGDFVGYWNPTFFRPGELGTDVTWHDVGDDWQMACIGELSPRAFLRSDPGRPALIPVSDSLGRIWHAPAVLSPTGASMLSMPLGRDDKGNWIRKPTPEQARLITAATFLRQELEALEGEGDQQRSRWLGLSLDVLADTTAALLGSVYPFSTSVFGVLNAFDDVLIRHVHLASTGLLPQPEAKA